MLFLASITLLQAQNHAFPFDVTESTASVWLPWDMQQQGTALTIDGRESDDHNGECHVWRNLNADSEYVVQLQQSINRRIVRESCAFQTQKENWSASTNDFPRPVYAFKLDGLTDEGRMWNFANPKSSCPTSINEDGFKPDTPTPSFAQALNCEKDEDEAWKDQPNSVHLPRKEFNERFLNKAITIETWFKPRALSEAQDRAWLCAAEDLNGNILGISVANDDRGADDSGRVMFICQNGSTSSKAQYPSAKNSINAGDWQHIAVVFAPHERDKSTVTWYINGQVSQKHSARQASPLSGPIESEFVIGTNPQSTSAIADGLIAGFKVYDVALTSDQIQQSLGNFNNFGTTAGGERMGMAAAPTGMAIANGGSAAGTSTALSLFHSLNHMVQTTVAAGLLLLVPAIVPTDPHVQPPIQPRPTPTNDPKEPVSFTHNRPLPNSNPGIPIDGGILILMLTGTMFGIMRLRTA